MWIISLFLKIIIADVCFKGGYIETWGTGTLKIIDACKYASLPEPEIKEANGGILVTLFKDRFTEERLQKLGLNERQIKAVIYVKEKGRIANKEYISLFNVSRITATRDLNGLVDSKIFKSSKIKGAGSFYELFAS